MSRFTLLLAVFCLSSSVIQADDAKTDDIEFHTAALSFPCQDKTPKEFAVANPDRKIIEASIRLSAAFNLPEEQVDRIEYRLKMSEMPEGIKIFDYLPKTRLDPRYAAPIVVQQADATKSVKVVSLEGGAKVGFMLPNDMGANVNVGGKMHEEGAKEVSSNVQMSLLPPMQLVMAASTQEAGRTLLFKLKQFDRITLEGDKDFAFLAAVPKDWNGDCFMLECTAFLKESRTAAAKKTMMIGLYNSGDLAGRKQVEAIAKAYHPPLFISSKTPSDSSPKSPSKPPLISVNKSLDKYTGKYSCDISKVLTMHYDLKSDGSYIGHGTCILGNYNETGVWSVTNDVLFMRITIISMPVGELKDIDRINSKISSFNEKNRIILTESNYILRGE